MIDSMPRLYPSRGIVSIPHAGLGNRQNFGMRPRQILSENLKALMKARPDLDLLPKIVAASDKRLSNGTLDRIRRGASATDIDTLEELATTFGIEPWQLLIEGLNPQALHVLQQFKALVTLPYSSEAGNSDRMGKPDRKVVPEQSSSGHNDQTGPVFGPALTKLFGSAKGKENGPSTEFSSKPKAAPPKKRGGKHP